MSERRALLLASVVAALGAGGAWAAYVLIGRPLIEAMYHEQALPWLNALITDREAPLEGYFRQGRVLLSRAVLAGVAVYGVVMAVILRERTRRILWAYFTAADHPLNLAVFRIVLFWLLYHQMDEAQLVWFSQIPETLRMPPIGSGWLIDLVPINPTWAVAAARSLQVICVAGMFGIFSRTSAVLAVILGWYVLGIPQWFGKVNHYHHLLWFASLLAVSRCGDAFSVDALLAGWRRAGRGLPEPPGPSRAYALPIRFVWLLIGVIYFFPGFWKVWASGFDWALSDNLKFMLYRKWMEFGDWTPALRIDQYPALYRTAAVGTLLFELSFVWLMFFPKLRLLAAAGGVAFHTLTGMIMRITFTSLKLCYLVFIDWHRLFQWVGRRLYREPLFVLYDGNCRLCRRTIGLLRVFDLLGRVTYLNALNPEALRTHGLGGLDQRALLVDMHAVTSRARRPGFDAYRAIAWRLPLLWPVAPVLYVWPITAAGRRLYRRIADRRSCEIRSATAPSAKALRPDGPARWRPVAVVGGALVAMNAACGLLGIVAGWPFACYPTFQSLARPTFQSIEVSLVTSAGDVVQFDDAPLRQRFSTERYQGLVRRLLGTKDPSERSALLREFWSLWARTGHSLEGVRLVRFHQVEWASAPERRREPALTRRLLHEFDLSEEPAIQARRFGGG